MFSYIHTGRFKASAIYLFLSLILFFPTAVFAATSLPVTLNLILRYDATNVNGNGTTPANNAAVSEWKDLSGSNYHTFVPSGKSGATYISDAGDGLPAILFGTTSSLSMGNLNLTTLTYTLFIVERYRSTGNTGRLWESRTSGRNWLFGLWWGRQMIYTDSGTYYPDGAAPITRGTWYIHSGGYTSSPARVYFYANRSVLYDSAPVGTNYAPEYMTLGVQVNFTDETSDAEAREVLIYNRELTTIERQSVEAYLTGKWFPYDDTDGDGVPNGKDDYPTDATKVVDFPTALQSLTPNIKLWLDASDSRAVSVDASTNKVNAWYDWSGKQNHASINASITLTAGGTWDFRPSRDPNANLLNGYPTVAFAGSHLLKLPNATFPTGDSSYSLFTVIKNSDTKSFSGYFFSGDDASNKACSFMFSSHKASSDGTDLRHYWWDNDIDSSKGSAPLNQFNLIGYAYDKTINLNGANARFNYINGGLITPNSFYTPVQGNKNTSPSYNMIGFGVPWGAPDAATINASNATNGDKFFNGAIAEMIILKQAVSTSDRRAIEDYLMKKWLKTNPSSETLPAALLPVSPNLALWLQADTTSPSYVSVSTRNTNEISAWYDWSGNYRHALATVTTNSLLRPKLVTDPISGKTVVRFAGPQLSGGSYFTDVLTGQGNKDIYKLIILVLKQGGFSPVSDEIIQMPFAFTDYNNGNFSVRTQRGYLRTTFVPASLGTGFNLGDFHYDGDASISNQNLFINGSVPPPIYALNTDGFQILSVRNTYSNDLNGYTLSNTYLNRGFMGDIAEVLAFTSGVTEPQRLAIEAYLRDKWNTMYDTDKDGVPTPYDVYDTDASKVRNLPTELLPVSANLAIFLDGKHPSGNHRSSTNLVDSLYDLSGKQNHFNAVSYTAMPSHNSSAALGGYGIEFTNAQNLIMGATVTTNKPLYTPSAKKGLSIVALVYPKSSTTNVGYLLDQGFVGNYGVGLAISTSNIVAYSSTDSGGTVNALSLIQTSPTPSVVSLVISFNATQSLYVNRALITANAIPTLNALDDPQINYTVAADNESGPVTLGLQSKLGWGTQSSRFFSGYLGKLLVFQEPLSDTNRRAVETYLLTDYGRSLQTVYVSGNATQGTGASGDPFNTFPAAVESVDTGGKIIFNGNPSAPINFSTSKNVILQHGGGSPKSVIP